jgi:hypothetical protein
VRRRPPLIVGLGAPALVLALSSCGSPAAQSSTVSPTTSDPGTADACPHIEVRNPSGERIDLNGTWVTELEGFRAGIYYFRQLGTCVWFSGAYPPPAEVEEDVGPLGLLTVVFHGSIDPTLRITGDWVDARQQFPGHIGPGGTLELRVEFTDEGETQIVYVGGTGEPFIEPSLREDQTWVRVSTGGAYPPPAP